MTLHFWMVQIAFNIHWSCSIKLCIADGIWELQSADFIYGTRYEVWCRAQSLGLRVQGATSFGEFMHGSCWIRTASTRQVVFSRSPLANSSRGSDWSCLRDVRSAFLFFRSCLGVLQWGRRDNPAAAAKLRSQKMPTRVMAPHV